jgi:hypothetical protein
VRRIQVSMTWHCVCFLNDPAIVGTLWRRKYDFARLRRPHSLLLPLSPTQLFLRYDDRLRRSVPTIVLLSQIK